MIDARKASITVAFEVSADLKAFNPFDVESAFGKPFSVSIGDATEREQIYEAALQQIVESGFDSRATEIAQQALDDVDKLLREEIARKPGAKD